MKFAWDEAVKVWLPSVPLHHIQVCEKTKKKMKCSLDQHYFLKGYLLRKGLHRQRSFSHNLLIRLAYKETRRTSSNEL